MEQPPQAGKPGSTPPSDHGRPEATAPAGGDIFDLGFPAPRAVAASPEEPFADLLAAAPAAAAVAPSAAAVAEAAPEPEEAPEPEDVLFPGLAGRESRQRYLDRLGAEGIFLLDLTGTPSFAPSREPAAAAPHEPAVTEEEAPVFDLTERTPWAEEPAPLEAEPAVSAAAAPAAAEPMATATLGEIYLKQGHHGEAERIFREVLRREPANAAAQEGLARAAGRRRERRPLEARDLLAGYEPVAAGEAETRARKAWVLKGYLQRLRQGGQHDVS